MNFLETPKELLIILSKSGQKQYTRQKNVPGNGSVKSCVIQQQQTQLLIISMFRFYVTNEKGFL